MNFVKSTLNFVKGKGGFSLNELLVALVIMSVVSSAIYGVFSISSRSYTTQSVTADVQQSVRSAMELMLQDIRAAGLDPTASGYFGIEQAEAEILRFTSDSIDAGLNDFNGILEDKNSEQITYVLEGTRLNQILYETIGKKTSAPLIKNVQNLKFSYFDADGNNLGNPVPPTQLSYIRTINVSITVEESAGRDTPVRRTLTNGVKCRNMGL